MNHSPITHIPFDIAVGVRRRISAAVVVAPSGCWLWQRRLDRSGYGSIAVRLTPCVRRTTGAHRASYLVSVGDISDGLHIDHLCRVRACVNPAHLEAVTPKENQDRGLNPIANRAQFGLPEHIARPRAEMMTREFCRRGHLWEKNLKLYVDPRGYEHRTCGQCTKDRRREWRDRQAQARE